MSQTASSGVARASTSRAGRPELRQPGRARHHGPAAGRVVQDHHQRARRVTGHAPERDRRAGGREHQRHDQQGAEQQEQQVLQLEPALVLARRRDEISDRRKDHGRRLPTGQQVEQHGDRGRREAGQRPRMEKADHPAREAGAGASASRSTVPNGVVGDHLVVADAVSAAGQPPVTRSPGGASRDTRRPSPAAGAPPPPGSPDPRSGPPPDRRDRARRDPADGARAPDGPGAAGTGAR